MRASDIATRLDVVDRTTPAVEAVRLVAERDLPGLVVAEHDGHPSRIVSSIDVLRLMLPDYLIGDLSLTNTLDDTDVADLHTELRGRTMGDLVDDEQVSTRDVLVVPASAGLVEIAARMVDSRTQVALLDDPTQDAPSFVTLPAVMDAIVGLWDRPGGTVPASQDDDTDAPQ